MPKEAGKPLYGEEIIKNEGVEGVVDPGKIRNLYAEGDTKVLRAALSTLQSGSGRRCMAKKQITTVLLEMLRERESS